MKVMNKTKKKPKSLDFKIDSLTNTVNSLAISVAKGFDRVEKKLSDKIDTEIGKVKEDIKDVRKDILNLGDRFVSYHSFDVLARRVKTLEERR